MASAKLSIENTLISLLTNLKYLTKHTILQELLVFKERTQSFIKTMYQMKVRNGSKFMERQLKK